MTAWFCGAGSSVWLLFFHLVAFQCHKDCHSIVCADTRACVSYSNSVLFLGSRSPGLRPGSQMPMHNAGDGDGGRWGGAGTPGANLNEQIVVALARLQEDMQSVLERLHTLEALTASQV